MYMHPVTTSAVYNTITSLKTAAAGADEIHSRLLKKHAALLSPVFAQYINMDIDDGNFSSSLKKNKACVLFKTGERMRPDNYRLISLASSPSKVFETLLKDAMIEFLMKTRYLSLNQYGFLPKSDTGVAANDLVTDVQNTLNAGRIAAVIYIDVSKAFDSVNHDILLGKLYKAGIRGHLHDLMRSFLIGRSFYIDSSSTISHENPVKTGVPQGSVIGPLQFLIYMNDIFKLKLHGKLRLLADDGAALYNEENEEVLAAKMSEALQTIFDWFCANKLAMNVQKTKYMVFAHPRKKIDFTKIDLNVNGCAVERVVKYKYLGLILDQSLSWVEHIKYVARKVSSLTGALRKARPHLHPRTLTTIYFSEIHSRLLYMSHLWGSANKSNMQLLEVLQNKAIRLLFRHEYMQPRVHTNDLYKNHKILPVKQLASYSACLMTFKLKHSFVRSDINLQRNEHIHNYNTRTRNNIHVTQPKNQWGKAAITYRVVVKI